MAMVTICVSEATMARSISSLELNFPVPINSRDVNSFPAIISFSIIVNLYRVRHLGYGDLRSSATRLAVTHNVLFVEKIYGEILCKATETLTPLL